MPELIIQKDLIRPAGIWVIVNTVVQENGRCAAIYNALECSRAQTIGVWFTRDIERFNLEGKTTWRHKDIIDVKIRSHIFG
jgi:hypothetical protein